MVKVKLFYGASSDSIEKLNDFLSTVKVIDVKYQMTDENDAFVVIYEDSTNLSEVPTCKLVEELKNREGVITHEIAPYTAEYSISVKSTETEVVNLLSENDSGAIILEVID
ncbi:BC1881 family protein [Clostridium sulfidigenes]|uniref:BC1881 family protein n=1 Tax=Clostridium sulfidigenes TaxID=318464 RepID=UPI003F8AED4D